MPAEFFSDLYAATTPSDFSYRTHAVQRQLRVFMLDEVKKNLALTTGSVLGDGDDGNDKGKLPEEAGEKFLRLVQTLNDFFLDADRKKEDFRKKAKKKMSSTLRKELNEVRHAKIEGIKKSHPLI